MEEHKLELPADSVEFIPSYASSVLGDRDIVCVGTYKLIEDVKKKVGKLYFFQVIEEGREDGNNSDPLASTSVQQLLGIETNAILDLKW